MSELQAHVGPHQVAHVGGFLHILHAVGVLEVGGPFDHALVLFGVDVIQTVLTPDARPQVGIVGLAAVIAGGLGVG